MIFDNKIRFLVLAHCWLIDSTFGQSRFVLRSSHFWRKSFYIFAQSFMICGFLTQDVITLFEKLTFGRKCSGRCANEYMIKTNPNEREVNHVRCAHAGVHRRLAFFSFECGNLSRLINIRVFICPVEFWLIEFTSRIDKSSDRPAVFVIHRITIFLMTAHMIRCRPVSW